MVVVHERGPGDWDKGQIVAQSLKTGERKLLISGGSEAIYVPSGHIMYAYGGVELAVPFDAKRVTVTGGAVPVIEGVRRSLGGTTGTAHLAVSPAGSLVFVPGPAASGSTASFNLVLIGLDGTVQPLKLPAAPYEYPRVSPDGKQIAYAIDDGKDAAVWIYDLSESASVRRLTLSGRNRVPVWIDRERIAFQSNRDGDLAIFVQRADGTTPAQRLTKPEKDVAHVPESASPDGKILLFSVMTGPTYRLAALSLPDGKQTPIAGVESRTVPAAAFSPDGKWFAYSALAGSSTRTAGRLFVQPFPPTGATYQIAPVGVHPFWSPDGKRLFWGPGPNSLVSASVTATPAFAFGKATAVIRTATDRGPLFERANDMMPDGKKLLAVIPPGSAPSGAGASAPAQQLEIVWNWFDELKTRVPTGNR